MEPADRDRLELGRVARAHGVRGDVVIDPITNRPERFIAGAVLYVNDRRMVVVNSRPHQGRFIVTLEGVPDRNTAETLRGALVTGDPLGELPPDEFWLHELIGRPVRVTDADDVVGHVAAIEVNPASDLLVLDTGHLVPSRFITDITGDEVVVDVPDGLFDL